MHQKHKLDVCVCAWTSCDSRSVLQLADIVQARSEQGKDYGVVLLPEGLIESVPDVGHLIAEINDVLASNVPAEAQAVEPKLSAKSKEASISPNCHDPLHAFH